MTGQEPQRRVEPAVVHPGAMSTSVARQVRALLRHLDGTAPADLDRLAAACRRLDTQAAVALGAPDGLRRGPLVEALATAGGASAARGRRTLR